MEQYQTLFYAKKKASYNPNLHLTLCLITAFNPSRAQKVFTSAHSGGASHVSSNDENKHF